MGAWRNEMWLESMPPSSAWNQLQSCTRFEMNTWLSGSTVHSSSGNGGGVAGPMYAHMTPPRSTHGYAVWQTFAAKLDSRGSLGMSTHCPSRLNFQPW